MIALLLALCQILPPVRHAAGGNSPVIVADLQTDLNASVVAQVGGKSDTSTEWVYFTGDDWTPDSNNWAYGLDWSGFLYHGGSNSTSLGSMDIALITAKHGITCAHAWPTPTGIVYAVGNDTVTYTNSVSADSGDIYNDIRVITFDHDWPAAVKPFYVMPVNCTNYFPGHFLGGTMAIWFRNNSKKMNVQNVTTFSPPLMSAWTSAGIVFFENPATAGDSGSPIFFLLGTQLIFAYALHYSDIQGPFVSTTDSAAAIAAVLGAYTPTYVNISSYRTY